MLQQKQAEARRICFGLQCESTAHHGKKITDTGSWLNYIHNLEAESDKYQCSVHFLLFIQCGISDHETILPTFKVSLST